MAISAESLVPETAGHRIANVLDVPFASMTYQQILDHMESRIARNMKSLYVPMNVDVLRLATQNRELRDAVKKASVVFADGMPILWLAQLRKLVSPNAVTLPMRIPGCDIVQDMCELSHQKGYRIFFLGAAPGVAAQAADKLRAKLPDVNIVGTYSPKFSELKDAQQNDAILKMINDSGAQVLMVALGAPKQEIWLAENMDKLNATVLIPCGGSIDFIAGVQKKSPKWIGRLGMEWLFRMASNPARLFDRYILKDLPFLAKACTQSLSF